MIVYKFDIYKKKVRYKLCIPNLDLSKFSVITETREKLELSATLEVILLVGKDIDKSINIDQLATALVGLDV